MATRLAFFTTLGVRGWGPSLVLFICDWYGGFWLSYQESCEGEGVQMSHLLFIDDTLIFCEAS